jgi:hypothetical protein
MFLDENFVFGLLPPNPEDEVDEESFNVFNAVMGDTNIPPSYSSVEKGKFRTLLEHVFSFNFVRKGEL